VRNPKLRVSHLEDIWVKNGPQYAAPFEEVQQALCDLLADDWRTVWDRNTKIDSRREWYLKRDAGLWAWASYAADFRLRQTGKISFTAEDYYQFHLCDEIKRVGTEALADEYFHRFRDYEFATKNEKFIQNLNRALTNTGRQPNREFVWFCFLWDRFVIPLQFWTNEAIAGYYRANRDDDGKELNKERIRDWKRALKLKEASPVLVRGWDDANNRIKLETRPGVLARIDKIYGDKGQGFPIPRLPGQRK
jgi:hypothetical protein